MDTESNKTGLALKKERKRRGEDRQALSLSLTEIESLSFPTSEPVLVEAWAEMAGVMSKPGIKDMYSESHSTLELDPLHHPRLAWKATLLGRGN